MVTAMERMRTTIDDMIKEYRQCHNLDETSIEESAVKSNVAELHSCMLGMIALPPSISLGT